MPHNAANRDSYPVSLPGTAYGTTPALKFFLTGNGKIEARVYVEGKAQYNPASESNSVRLKFQASSDDGLLDPWADIIPDNLAAANIDVVPMGEAFALFPVSKRYLRVLGFGNEAAMLDLSWSGLDGLQLMEF